MNEVVNHLWQSTLFAAVVAVAALALKQNQAKTRHALWVAASAKFLIPFSLLVALGTRVEIPVMPQVMPAVRRTDHGIVCAGSGTEDDFGGVEAFTLAARFGCLVDRRRDGDHSALVPPLAEFVCSPSQVRSLADCGPDPSAGRSDADRARGLWHF